MERATKISFMMLLAALALIANKAMPHHHHLSEICFSANHCHSGDDHSEDAPAHHDEDFGHHHDGTGNCQLDVYYLVAKGTDNTGKQKPQQIRPDKEICTSTIDATRRAQINGAFVAQSDDGSIPRPGKMNLPGAMRAPPV